MKNAIRVAFLIIFCFTGWSLFGTDIPWKKETDKNGVTVYLRDYKGSQISEFKAQTLVKAPLNAVVNLLLDFNSYPKWVFCNRNTFVIEKRSSKEYIYYTIITCPKPTTDRDLIVLFKITEQSDNKCIIQTTCLPKHIGEKSKVVRVTEFVGFWELTKVNDRETLVTTQCHTEPGGNVPSWLINYMITTGPFKTLSNMHEILLERVKKK
jgi:ribosome-associated toxin RatA of RatAB toxin-antitoxin module